MESYGYLSKMKIKFSEKGFTLAEVLVMSILTAIILLAGTIVFISGQNAFSYTSARAELAENSRRTLQRISYELQESGRDNNSALQITILDGVGVSGTDILRFSVPLCVCGLSPIDSNGNVSRWGAPLLWGQSGCSTNYPVGNNNKVDICHYPPGNPNNSQDLSVNLNAVKAHLAHGDYIGSCGSCDPSSYNNKVIEYLMDANGQLVRSVIDGSANVLVSSVISNRLTDFQVTFNAGQTVVSVTAGFSMTASQNRTLISSKTIDVFFRNGG